MFKGKVKFTSGAFSMIYAEIKVYTSNDKNLSKKQSCNGIRSNDTIIQEQFIIQWNNNLKTHKEIFFEDYCNVFVLLEKINFFNKSII